LRPVPAVPAAPCVVAAPSLGARLRADAARLAGVDSALDGGEALRWVFAVLEHALGLSSTARVLAEGEPVARFSLDAYERSLARLLAGEPLAYVLGEQPFRHRVYQVSAAVLVPRPDTETLVEAALTHLAPDESVDVLDLGTGSGCVAVEIALARPRARVTAVDASAAALAVARGNAARLGAAGVAFLQSDWYEALAGRRFHLVVANPPYVAEADPHLARLAAEPRTALVAGPDGLADLQSIVAQAPDHLNPGGWLCVEHGFAQGEAVRALFALAGFGAITTLRDGGGRARVCAGRWGGPAGMAG
jgi:release factor glutamine methyltransferase